MLAVGLEPTRSYEQRILSPHRIPIPTCQLIARLFVKLHLTIQTQLKLANTIRLDLQGTAFTFRCIGSIQELQFAPCITTIWCLPLSVDTLASPIRRSFYIGLRIASLLQSSPENFMSYCELA